MTWIAYVRAKRLTNTIQANKDNQPGQRGYHHQKEKVELDRAPLDRTQTPSLDWPRTVTRRGREKLVEKPGDVPHSET